ncbi:MAG: hypothetical protein P8M80_06350 [Pirellulaceae bacterium]|nr:hypothetical protein [Pirellulaceae bacterium]
MIRQDLKEQKKLKGYFIFGNGCSEKYTDIEKHGFFLRQIWTNLISSNQSNWCRVRAPDTKQDLLQRSRFHRCTNYRLLDEVQARGIDVAIWIIRFADNTTQFVCKRADIDRINDPRSELEGATFGGKSIVWIDIHKT